MMLGYDTININSRYSSIRFSCLTQPTSYRINVWICGNDVFGCCIKLIEDWALGIGHWALGMER